MPSGKGKTTHGHIDSVDIGHVYFLFLGNLALAPFALYALGQNQGFTYWEDWSLVLTSCATNIRRLESALRDNRHSREGFQKGSKMEEWEKEWTHVRRRKRRLK